MWKMGVAPRVLKLSQIIAKNASTEEDESNDITY